MLFGLPATLGGPLYVAFVTMAIKGPLIAFILINTICLILLILIEVLIYFIRKNGDRNL